MARRPIPIEPDSDDEVEFFLDVDKYLPLEIFESLALQIAKERDHDCVGLRALVRLSSTCSSLSAHAQATNIWDKFVARHFSFYHRRRLDRRIAFPFVSPADATFDGVRPNIDPRSELEVLTELCQGVVGAREAHDLVGDAVAWVNAVLTTSTAAYSRPTIGAVAEKLPLTGGLSNLKKLATQRTALSRQLRVIECDISKLPVKVDFLVIPSNEGMRSPGWGAMEAIYKQGGTDLLDWLSERDEFTNSSGNHMARLRPGDVMTSPAFGTINASWVGHACGNSFYDAHTFQQYAQMGEEGAKLMSSKLLEAVHKQLLLIRRIFKQAAQKGAKTIAIPAVSAGKRGFPSLLASAVTLAHAATEVRASGGDLTVFIVAYGDENHLDAFECAKYHALRKLVPHETPPLSWLGVKRCKWPYPDDDIAMKYFTGNIFEGPDCVTREETGYDMPNTWGRDGTGQ